MLETINREKSNYYIAGISGGPDSMVLLWLLIKQGYKVVVAHVNYNHRGDDSLRDQKIVENFCLENNVPCKVLSVHYQKGNFEAWARDIRYDFYSKLASEYKADGVFLGHQQDDHLETYLMQKEKKSEFFHYGIREEGKVGEIKVIRPLLNHSKKEIQEYADSIGLIYGIDTTNMSDEHTRNRYRKKIALYSPKEREELLEEITRKNQENQERTAAISLKIGIFEDYSLEEYLKYPIEERIQMIRYYLFSKGLDEVLHYTRNHLLEIDKQLISKENQRIILNDHYQWDKDYGKLFFHSIFTPYSHRLDKIEMLQEEYFAVSDKGTGLEGVFVKDDDFPLTIRNYEPSDSISLRFGNKRLSRFFIDRKIPHYRRECWPVVLNRHQEIILVPGIGCRKESYAKDYNMYVSTQK